MECVRKFSALHRCCCVGHRGLRTMDPTYFRLHVKLHLHLGASAKGALENCRLGSSTELSGLFVTADQRSNKSMVSMPCTLKSGLSATTYLPLLVTSPIVMSVLISVRSLRFSPCADAACCSVANAVGLPLVFKVYSEITIRSDAKSCWGWILTPLR